MVFLKPSLTQQSHIEHTNINKILGRYAKTGILGNPGLGQPRQPQYGDFSSDNSFQNMVQTIQDAEDSFQSLPLPIRKKFDNDPGKLIDFMADPKNLKESQDLGLRPTPEKPVRTVTVPPKSNTVTPPVTPDPSNSTKKEG